MELGSPLGPDRGPVYIYNGVSNLRELKDVNLFGANLFFNGSFDIKDLQNTDLVGANVFLNGASQTNLKEEPSTSLNSSMMISMSTKRDGCITDSSTSRGPNALSDLNPVANESPKAMEVCLPESAWGPVPTQAKTTDIHHQKETDNGSCHSAAQMHPFGTNDLIQTAVEPLQKQFNPTPFELSANLTPLSLSRGFCSPICEDHVRTSELKDRYNERSSPFVQFDVQAVVAKPAPNPPLAELRSANARLPEPRLQSQNVPKRSHFDHPVNKALKHGLSDSPAKIALQKRNPAKDDSNYSDGENKKPKLENKHAFNAAIETERLLQEEMQRGERARQIADRGDYQAAAAEFEEIRKLSNQRMEIKPQLPVQSTSQRKRRSRGGQRKKVALLPEHSPLNNVIHSASLHEEVIQAKLEVNLAQNQAVVEKATLGSASGNTMARLKALRKTLEGLNKKRGEIKKDANRMGSFRRYDVRQQQKEVDAVTDAVSKSPPPWLADKQWREGLTLCYEAPEKPVTRSHAPKYVKRYSTTMPLEGQPMLRQDSSDLDGDVRMEETRDGALAVANGDEPMIKEESSHQNGLARREEAPDCVLPVRQRPGSRFALTKVETLL